MADNSVLVSTFLKSICSYQLWTLFLTSRSDRIWKKLWSPEKGTSRATEDRSCEMGWDPHILSGPLLSFTCHVGIKVGWPQRGPPAPTPFRPWVAPGLVMWLKTASPGFPEPRSSDMTFNYFPDEVLGPNWVISGGLGVKFHHHSALPSYSTRRLAAVREKKKERKESSLLCCVCSLKLDEGREKQSWCTLLEQLRKLERQERAGDMAQGAGGQPGSFQKLCT